jgi:hypothetical protein
MQLTGESAPPKSTPLDARSVHTKIWFDVHKMGLVVRGVLNDCYCIRRGGKLEAEIKVQQTVKWA